MALVERWNGRRWSIQHVPLPDAAATSTLNAVSCSSASACTAVGYWGNQDQQWLLVERWNGHRWSIQHARPRTGSLNGVMCSSASACLAVGYSVNDVSIEEESPLVERWNDGRWSVQPVPVPAGQQTSALNAISCSSARACTAVGRQTRSKDGYPQELPLVERWNGGGWSVQPAPTPRGGGSSSVAELLGVSCPSAGACTAVGDSSVDYSCGSEDCLAPVPLAERWTRR